MAEWRRVAMQTLTKRPRDAEHASSLGALWGTLLHDVQYAATGTSRSDAAEEIWAFVAWCLAPQRSVPVRRAVIESFLRHLPHVPSARAELLRRLPPEQLADLRPALARVLTDAELLVWDADLSAAARGA